MMKTKKETQNLSKLTDELFIQNQTEKVKRKK